MSHFKSFEITYRDERCIVLKAKSRRTLDKRLSKETRENSLIREVKE